MREGDKLASYRILAAALERLQHLPWRLDVVGDGEAREEIVATVRLPGATGAVSRRRSTSRSDLRALYEAADLFVWPAVNEAYGMVLLEAQALGCPVVAGAYGGVASVVQARRDRSADDSRRHRRVRRSRRRPPAGPEAASRHGRATLFAS